jgi:outer membrane protein OmpA-like peptidoglycan-associated protein
VVDGTQIKPHMPVVGSDGAHVGTVDKVEGDRIKLAKSDSDDGRHHYVPLSAVTLVDTQVHLAMAAATALASAAADDGHASPLPPIQNRAVEHATPRRNFYLPWIVGIIGVILLLLLLKSCFSRDGEPVATTPPADNTAAAAPADGAALPVEAVALPNGRSVDLEPRTLNYELQRYLASAEPTPRTFRFDKLNFDTASAAIRPADQPNLDALAQILTAYPKAKVKVVGYTDARGSTPANADLGQQRATAVLDALVAKGVARDRIEAATGGEANPTGTNATASGQFENRRTELMVLAK